MTPSRRRAAIAAFCALFFGGQIALVAASHRRGDRLFGYQMFAETSRFEAHLYRVTVDGRRLRAPGGIWSAQGPDGAMRTYAWQHWVRDFRIDNLDRKQRARVGIGLTLKFIAGALDHVATRIPEDRETARLEMEVRYWTADGAEHVTTLSSRDRGLAVPEGAPR